MRIQVLAVLALLGCVQDLPKSKFLFATPADQGKADAAADVPDATTNATDAAADGADAAPDVVPDTADVPAACTPSYPEPFILTTPDEQKFHGGVVQPDGSLVLAEVFNSVDNPYSRLIGVAGGLDVKLNKLQQEVVYGVVADGTGWALAGSVTGTSGDDVLFARVSASGAVQVEIPIDFGGSEHAIGLSKVGNNFALFGRRSKPSSVFLVFVDSKGACIGDSCKTGFYKGSPTSEGDYGDALAVAADGSYFLVGESQTGVDFGAIDGVLYHIGTDGKELWHKVYGAADDDWFYAILPAKIPVGSWVLAGSKGGGTGWLLAVDANGNVLWEATLPGCYVIDSLVAVPYGWVAATTTAGGQKLFGVDPSGNILWSKTYLGSPYQVLAVPTGLAVIGGLQGDAQVMFTDLWGNETCAAADKCAGVLSCDDGKACTDDICVAKSGCTHTVANDGQWCGDGDACLQAGKCAGGKCVAGKALDCDDKNTCTDDSCDKVKGCVHVAKANCTP